MPENDGRPTIYSELTLDLHADVTEWNPNSGNEHLFVAGTYELDERTQTRFGKLYTYSVEQQTQNGDGDSQTSDVHVRRIGKVIDTPGIFDLRWIPGEVLGSTTAVVGALADGSLTVFDTVLSSESDGEEREERTGTLISSEKSSAMALSVDCLRGEMGGDSNAVRVTSSYSDGAARVHHLSNDGEMSCIRAWEAHSLEAWVSSWSRHHGGNVIYTGGDDAKFAGWDIRQPGEGTCVLAFQDRKSHNAGVCCIVETPGQGWRILTGSYDQYIRVWDARYTTKPVCSTQLDTGGGVWRLKINPHEPQLILAACMHHGFSIFRVDVDTAGDQISIDLCERYPYQQTLAYGCGWSHMKPQRAFNGPPFIVSTCSFYDNLLHIWSPHGV